MDDVPVIWHDEAWDSMGTPMCGEDNAFGGSPPKICRLGQGHKGPHSWEREESGMRLPVLGRTYRYRYGYPWRWAVLAEVAWRLEHSPVLAHRAYGWRKAAERRGSPAL